MFICNYLLPQKQRLINSLWRSFSEEVTHSMPVPFFNAFLIYKLKTYLNAAVSVNKQTHAHTLVQYMHVCVYVTAFAKTAAQRENSLTSATV